MRRRIMIAAAVSAAGLAAAWQALGQDAPILEASAGVRQCSGIARVKPANGQQIRYAACATTAANQVATNVALSALNVGNLRLVTRIGYYAAGDSPALAYVASDTPCALNSGAGDGGSQIPSADGKCWIAGPMSTVDVRDFGVSAAARDNSAALNAAVAYAISSGINDVTLAPWSVNISSPIKIRNISNLRVRGRGGIGTSNLQLVSTAQDGIDIRSDASVTLENFTITGAPAATKGSCIAVAGASSRNILSRFRDLAINNCFNGIATMAAALWKMESVDIQGILNAGLIVQNTYNADEGDSAITDSLFSMNIDSSNYGIVQYSSGGLKISNTKFIGGAKGVCYAMKLASGASTSDLLITNVSCENTQYGFSFRRQGSAGTFSNVNLTGLQIINVVNPFYIEDTGTIWLQYVQVDGAEIAVSNGGTAYTLANAQYVTINGGVITCLGDPCTGISAGRSASGSAVLMDLASTPWETLPPLFLAVNIRNGALQASRWPTSCQGLGAGTIWSNSGVLSICP